MMKKALLVLSLVNTLMVLTTFSIGAAAQSKPAARNIDSVYLLAVPDSLFAGAERVDDFKIANDWVVNWKKQRTRIVENAKEKGANIVLIKVLGWGKHGRGFYSSGTLYYAKAAMLQQIISSAKGPEEGCAIVIFRDNGPSLATYKYDVTINEDLFKNFNDMSFIRKQLTDCYAPVSVTINKHRESIPPASRTRYFRLIKNSGLIAVANTIFIYPGGYTLQEVEDQELAQLLTGRLKRYEQ